MTPEAELTRASLARELQENSFLQEALTHYETEIIEQWKNSPLRDAEGREKLRLMLEAQNHFKKYLQATVDTGKLIEVQIKDPSKVRRLAQIVGLN